MKRVIILLALASLYQVTVFGQKKYEMVVEKTDGTETVFNVEDIARTYFRERSGSGGVAYTSCPDGNHPHMIDLGLPSGTLWACCNVGATTPEDYGGYYAWGETSEKSVYNEVTYQYCTGTDSDGDGWYDSNRQFQNIGSDIAGTQYDVATVKWGSGWCLPSHTQQAELVSNTTSEWTTVNGINGRKFTGSNGGTIFLPAAGLRWGSDLYNVGSSGYYWSSSLNESYPGYAWSLGFNSGDVYAGDSNRGSGQSVRPVRTN